MAEEEMVPRPRGRGLGALGGGRGPMRDSRGSDSESGGWVVEGIGREDGDGAERRQGGVGFVFGLGVGDGEWGFLRCDFLWLCSRSRLREGLLRWRRRRLCLSSLAWREERCGERLRVRLRLRCDRWWCGRRSRWLEFLLARGSFSDALSSYRREFLYAVPSILRNLFESSFPRLLCGLSSSSRGLRRRRLCRRPSPPLSSWYLKSVFGSLAARSFRSRTRASSASFAFSAALWESVSRMMFLRNCVFGRGAFVVGLKT